MLTSRIGADCQAVVRCLSTNLNVALRNGLQCIGASSWLPLPAFSCLITSSGLPCVLTCLPRSHLRFVISACCMHAGGFSKAVMFMTEHNFD